MLVVVPVILTVIGGYVVFLVFARSGDDIDKPIAPSGVGRWFRDVLGVYSRTFWLVIKLCYLVAISVYLGIALFGEFYYFEYAFDYIVGRSGLIHLLWFPQVIAFALFYIVKRHVYGPAPKPVTVDVVVPPVEKPATWPVRIPVEEPPVEVSLGWWDAISICLGEYATFRGRASRAEYWFWVAFTLPFGIVQQVTRPSPYKTSQDAMDIVWLVSVLCCLLLVVPTLAVTARRLRDINVSGWVSVILLIPFFGFIFIVVMACFPGTVGPNRFGLDPLRPSLRRRAAVGDRGK